MKFLKCNKCDTILGVVNSENHNINCCGEQIKELVANTQEASLEKHIPVVEVRENVVSVVVGSVLHPMSVEHHIAWVAIETEEGFQRKQLNVIGEPTITFALTANDKLKSVYAYCNLHGLWKVDF